MGTLYKSVLLGAFVTSLGTCAFGCGGSRAAASAASTSDTTYSKAYTVQASAATTAATGIVSWSVQEDTTGIHVDGMGSSNETIVAWKAISHDQGTGYETRYDLQMGKKAGTMTIDVNGHDFEIRENTFVGNEELHGVMAFLNADLDQQAPRSSGAALPPSGTTGGLVSTQSLSPQGTPLVQPACELVKDECSWEYSYHDKAFKAVQSTCGWPLCPTGAMRWVDELSNALGNNPCFECQLDQGYEAGTRDDLNKCVSRVNEACRRGWGS
jgi:hypothetical protein